MKAFVTHSLRERSLACSPLSGQWQIALGRAGCHVGKVADRLVSPLPLLVLILLCGVPGCGIPCLRGPQPGAPLPTSYNWNNGVAFLDHAGNSDDYESRSGDSDPSDAELDTAEPDQPRPEFDEPSSQFDGDASDADRTETPLLDVGTKTAHHEEQYQFASLLQNSDPPELLPAESHQTSSAQSSVQSSVQSSSHAGLLDEADTANDLIDINMGLAESAIGGASWENSSQLTLAQFFNDPYLLDLISQAFTGNQELKILSEEIRIACNETYARSGEYRPFVTLGGRAELEKSGRHTRDGAVEHHLDVAPGKAFPDPLPDFLVASNVVWELDIWKRLRNAQYAAAMRYLGTQEGRNYIATRVVAEVAENYYELLALDNRLATLDQTIEIQQQSMTNADAMKVAGRGTELAVQRFRAEVRKNQAEKLVIAQEIVETENRINFLLGRYPQHVDRISVEYIDLNLHALSAGVPSHLLQNRADIREAERNVTAAGLDVKVARARFYPSLTLTGGLGWNAFSTGYLFRTPESLIYSVAGEVVGPIINKRAIKAAYASANAAQLQTIYEYQRTVLEAHIEVVNYITKVENYRQSIEVKKQQLAALEASVDVAGKLFQNARAEYVEVLLAQREFMEAKMLLIQIKKDQLGAIVNAYQSLGGGDF